jgi:hypothetical protein
MKMKNLVCILLLIVGILFSCTKDELEGKDLIPPSKVHLVPHQGDPGDRDDQGNLIGWTDINNGIDAVPGEMNNWIKIEWDGGPLAMDGDIHRIEVRRFNDMGDSVIVDIIDYDSDVVSYIDRSLEYEEVVTDQWWSYYIIPYDEADNFTPSDTVSYYLIEKPWINAPNDNLTFSLSDTVTFRWSGNGDFRYRIVFFNDDGTAAAAKDIYHELEYTCRGSDLEGLREGRYTWRVDAFKPITAGMPEGGSESDERQITFY